MKAMPAQHLLAGGEASPSAEPCEATSTRSRPSSGQGTGLDRRQFLRWSGAAGAAMGLAGPVAARLSETSWGATPGTVQLSAEQAASRFLAQCTFGGDLDLIQAVASAGLENWLDQQLAQPLASLLEDVIGLDSQLTMPGSEIQPEYFDWAWWQRIMTGQDLVRQRVAFALSEIFVISRRPDVIFDRSDAVASYHDVLARHAFGNFRDLLLEVALHPTMGIYLSHANNRRSDPSSNRFPDENFAREVMQLFSIGLFELNPDGSRKLDGQGQPIPTYGNSEITEMAKVFTGLTFAPEAPGEPVFFGEDGENLVQPMVMYEPEHEPGAKTLLGGFVVPAGQSGMQDVEMAIEHLVQHPNVGPFIGRQLIQRLVTSNPSPGYVARVSAAFADNGSGVRGDMAAVIKAVLLDSEARDPARISDPTFGKVREPFVRWVQLGRAMHATSDSGRFRHFGGDVEGGGESEDELAMMSQYPYSSPSVFNFFSPGHQPAGPLTENGLVAPEMEIVHAYTAIATVNLLSRAIDEEWYLDDQDDAVWLDLSAEVELAESDPVAMVDRLDLLLTYGTLSSGSRQIILDAVLPLQGDPEAQVYQALFLFMICPEYAVQR